MNPLKPDSYSPELSPYSWRAIRPDDIPAIQEMFSKASAVDRTESAPSEDRLRSLLGMLGDQADKNTLLAIAPDGSIAGSLLLFIPPGIDEPMAMFDGIVAVNHRGNRIGSFMLQFAESRVREHFGSAGTGLTPTIRTSCTRHQEDRIRLFEMNGFQSMRYSYRMRRDMAEPVQKIPLPDSLRWVKWDPALEPPLMEAFNEAFSENWGVPRLNLETWRTFFTGVPQFRGDLTYLAMDGDTIAGFCVNWVEERIEGKEGWVEAIGVLPAWRGRGVASALLSNSLVLFRDQGLAKAGLDVDTQNPTGALRLYEKHGFEVAKETIHFAKSL